MLRDSVLARRTIGVTKSKPTIADSSAVVLSRPQIFRAGPRRVFVLLGVTAAAIIGLLAGLARDLAYGTDVIPVCDIHM